jgi:hypothetical protein
MLEVVTVCKYPEPLPKFLELQVSYHAGDCSFSKTGLVLDYNKNTASLKYTLFNTTPVETALLLNEQHVEIMPHETSMIWGWSNITCLENATIAIIDCLAHPVLLNAIVMELFKNNNRIFINVPYAQPQNTDERCGSKKAQLFYVPDFFDLAEEHVFSGAVALGKIETLQQWFKYNSLRCQHFAALIV